jgi:hypothetical protein
MNKYHSMLLSTNMSITTEGYLICHNVPICRSGYQEYLGSELEGTAGYDEAWGLQAHKKYRVYRPPKEVLDPDTIKSFEGKSVVDSHPSAEGNVVHIDNERYLNCGHMQNVREGEKYGGEVTLQADLWIKDPQLREKVRPEAEPNSPLALRDVSCGYTLKLRRTNGRLEMYYIRGNHVAVVEKGRAGPGISIQDSAPPEINPTRSTKMPLLDRIFGTGLKAVIADATPEELAELQKDFGKTHSVTPPVTVAQARVVADEDPNKDKNPHAIAAHHCLDRCLTAMKSKDKMGVDAFGAPAGVKDLYIELGRYVGDCDMGDRAVGDEKKETMAELEEKTGHDEMHQEEETPAEEKDKLGDAAQDINNTGMSALHAMDKAANDSVRENIKALRPIVAGFMSIPKKERTSEQQVVIDSYNKAVKAINDNKGNAYKLLTKVKQPESNDALIVVGDSVESVDVGKFFEGVPHRVGQQRYDDYLAKKGSK